MLPLVGTLNKTTVGTFRLQILPVLLITPLTESRHIFGTEEILPVMFLFGIVNRGQTRLVRAMRPLRITW